eukprot:456125-Hanusia_phi.AAC.1
MRSRDDWADAMYDVSWGVDGNRMIERDGWADDLYDISCAVDVLWTEIARQGSVSIALQTARSGDDWADAMYDV